jgi:putative alpha-1,2-mannosidase
LNAGDDAPFAYLANEPSALTPWIYDWLGEPGKTQSIVRRAIRQLFDASPAGFAGNDDLGQMSAWYVFGALGFYPAIPGTDVLTLGSPLFRRAVVDEGGGRSLTIIGHGADRERPYVKRLSVDGREHGTPWLRTRDLRPQGSLRFELSGVPGSWGRGPEGAPPSYPPDAIVTCAAP